MHFVQSNSCGWKERQERKLIANRGLSPLKLDIGVPSLDCGKGLCKRK